MFIGEIRRTGCLGLAVCCAILADGGALWQGTAEAAQVSQPIPKPGEEEKEVINSKDNDVVGNKVKARGRKINAAANSPTNNLGTQHNSSTNSAGQITFQNGRCEKVKSCRISQKVIVKRRFVAFGHLVRKPWVGPVVFFPLGTTVAATDVTPSLLRLSVRSP